MCIKVISSPSLSQRFGTMEETPTDKDDRRKHIDKLALIADKVWSSSSGLRHGLTNSFRIKAIFHEMLQRVLNYQKESQI
jgi:hypothetical protein